MFRVVVVLLFSLIIVSCTSGSGEDDLGRLNKFGAVVADDTYVAYIGREIMKTSGNAVDAIISMAMVSSVSNPGRISLASLGRCLIWQTGSETVASITTVDQGDAKTQLPMLQSILSLYSKYGTIPWSKLLLPAELAARGGVLASTGLLEDLVASQDVFTDEYTKSFFIKKGASLPKEGELIRILPLANTLSQLRKMNIVPSQDQEEGLVYKNIGIVSDFVSLVYQNSKANPPKIAFSWKEYASVYSLAGWDYFATLDTSSSLVGLRHIWQLSNTKDWLQNTWAVNQLELVSEELASNQKWMERNISKYNVANSSFISSRYLINKGKQNKALPTQKKDKLKTVKFAAVDYFGLAVSCTFSLGKAFGTAKILKSGFFLPENADDALQESGEWFVIDKKQNKFISLFMAGSKESIFPSARATVRVMLTGNSLSKALRENRFSLSKDLSSVYFEKDIDVKSYNDIKNLGLTITKKENIGSISAIFCPYGLPRNELYSLCMVEADIRKSGSGYVRIAK